jgi:mono/diheme cytochrome c family protein
MLRIGLVIGLLVGTVPVVAAELDAARRGEKALLERAFIPPFWSRSAYDNAWRQWALDAPEAPADYARLFRERYGLHVAPYANGGLPMGLRDMPFLFRSGVATDCLLCHGGSVAGQSYVGLGNASLDMQTLFEEMNLADGRPKGTPFTFCNVRGTNEAGSMSVFLIAYREPDLKLRAKPLELGLRDDLCEDVPAWWLLKKKQTMYHTGGTPARSVRSLMQFMLHPLNGPDVFQREEKAFEDIQAYLLSLEAPRYPFPVDAGLAKQGAALFERHCSQCHGAYGKDGSYPNKIVPLAEVGTYRTRFDGISAQFGEHYNRSWFAQGKQGATATAPTGYQAPPLDGVWATAPYFHNGSAPTVYHVLNSKARPKVFTRSYRTEKEDYDPEKLGWKVQVLDGPADPKLPPRERRKVYDTTQPGRGNAGHTFGDKLREDQRQAVLEYLTTL